MLCRCRIPPSKIAKCAVKLCCFWKKRFWQTSTKLAQKWVTSALSGTCFAHHHFRAVHEFMHFKFAQLIYRYSHRIFLETNWLKSGETLLRTEQRIKIDVWSNYFWGSFEKFAVGGGILEDHSGGGTTSGGCLENNIGLKNSDFGNENDIFGEKNFVQK